MPQTIEEFISRYFRQSNATKYTGRDEPGEQINASEAARLCEHLSPRQRASLDPQTISALSDLMEDAEKAQLRFSESVKKLKTFAWFKARRSPELEQSWMTLAVIYSVVQTRGGLNHSHIWQNSQRWRSIRELVEIICKRALKLTAEQSFTALECSAGEGYGGKQSFDYALLDAPMEAITRLRDQLKPNETDRTRLAAIGKQLEERGYSAQSRAWKNVIDEILADDQSKPSDLLWPGEPWAKVINDSVRALTESHRTAAIRLLKHAASASEFSKPAKAWFTQAKQIVDELGQETAANLFETWLREFASADRAALAASEQERIHGRFGLGDENDGRYRTNTAYMIGITHTARCITGGRLLPLFCDIIEKISRLPHVLRERAVNVAKAALLAIESSDDPLSIASLSRLSLRVRWPKFRKAIEKAYDKRLGRSGMSRDDADEAAVPDFGIRDGKARVAIGSAGHAEITVATHPRVTWHLTGKAATSVTPRSLKQERPDDVKTVKQTADEIEKMFAAQRARLDLLFRRPVSWPYSIWAQRYLQHGLVGALASRMIWLIDGVPLVNVAGEWQDESGRIAAGPPDNSTVALWHPALRPTDEALAWRQRLETLNITQPIKQAHREVYLLTDAERRTNTYSNRFAAHIVRSHVVLPISQVRKWKMGLYGGASSPTILLPHFGLRAEWWVEPVGDERDRMGFPRYFATDQVRFYRNDQTDPMPLCEVPPLALTEVMRDVDLFVGLASVGNDPTWQDGGPQNRFRDYWRDYSFGELNETAKTRKQVLQRLVPRLKIASRCSLDDKFLVVKGDIRSYKIHLGSGNILMFPNDQYLCIVPDRGSKDDNISAGIHLPFEGDSTLSVILSKAFLLAEDTKITDPTIVSQLKR